MKRKLGEWFENAYAPQRHIVFYIGDMMAVIMALYLQEALSYESLEKAKPLFEFFFDKKPRFLQEGEKIKKKISTEDIFHSVLQILLNDCKIKALHFKDFKQMISYFDSFTVTDDFKDCIQEIYKKTDLRNVVLSDNDMLYFVYKNRLMEIPLDQDGCDWLAEEAEVILHGVKSFVYHREKNSMLVQLINTTTQLKLDLDSKSIDVVYDIKRKCFDETSDEIAIGEFGFTEDGKILCNRTTLDHGYYDRRKEEIGFLNTKLPGCCCYDLVTQKPVIYLYTTGHGVNTRSISEIEQQFHFKPGSARLVLENREIER